MYDPNMQYYEFDADGKTEEVAVPVEKTNAWLEEMKGKGWNVRPMEYFKFRGEKGETASVPRSELDDFYQSAMESGRKFAPVFTMVDARTGEEREFARWGRDARGSDEQAQTFIDADRESLANAQANGWTMKGVQDPKAKDIYDHFWNAENWTDPTGEDGALVWNAKNIAKGAAATAVAGSTGVGKAIPNAVLNIGAAGASLVGADDVADKLRRGRDWVNRILDHSVLTERILSGGEWDAKALKDFTLNSAESLGSLWGLGGAVKTVAKGLKLASGVEAAMEHASAGQAATINKMAGGAALATIMGAEAYEGAMADPRIRDAGPKGKIVAAANLLTAAATSRLFGKIVGLGVDEKLAQGIAKESFADALKVTGMEMLEFAGINELNAVTDEGAKLLTGLSDRDIGRITKRFGTEAVEGGKTVFLMRAGRYGRIGAGKAMEGMAETAERIAHHAAERRGVYFHEATKGFGKIEGRMEEIRRTNGGMTTEELVQEGMKIWEKEGDAEKPVVVAVTESGVGVLDDGGMVRKDGEGKQEVVTPNGVVVDETGGVKTVAPGRCGNVGEEYGVRVEGGRTADKPGAEIPSFGRQTVENACILLNEIEQGTCKGEVVDIDAITDILPSWKGEGGSGAETPAAENLPNAPLIVLEGTDGSLRLVNGRGRLAYAKAQGARQVRAVKLREADGWTPELAYCVDVVENLRGGAPIGGDAAVAAIEKLGLGYAEAKEMGLVGAKGGIVARAAVVVEYGSQHLIDAVKSQIIPFETAEMIVDSTVGDRLGVKSEEWNALTKELTGRLSLATRDEARDVMFELDRVIQEPGMDMADPASRRAAVDAAVDAAMERRRAERAERNGTTVEEETAIGSTPVETEDGRLTTVRGLEREKEEASHAEAQSRGEDAPEEETKRDATVGTELKPKEEGTFGCAAFPGARMSMQTVERADGTRGEAVVIEGLTAEEMLKPERREEATAFLQRAAKAAQEAGKELCIPDEAAREAAMRLLEDRAVEETREEMARAEEQRRTDEVAASGQAELANKVFGGTATVRVGTERERAEVERMGSDGDRRQSIGEKRYLRDGEGVFGYWDRAKKECVLFRGADETTLAHEMGWHAAYQWAEENNPALFRKMKEWAASCPEELREAIREAYGEDGPLTEDVLLDEFGAGRFEREHADTLKRALQKPEAKHWWTKLMRMVADAWKGALRRMGGDRINLKNIERMTPEEAVRFLAGQMAKGRKLGEFGKEEKTAINGPRAWAEGHSSGVPDSRRDADPLRLRRTSGGTVEIVSKMIPAVKRRIQKIINGDVEFKPGTKAPTGAILSQLGRLLEMRHTGRFNSRYGIYETPKGKVAFRLSGHAAEGENFSRDKADRNTSVVLEMYEWKGKETTVPYEEFRFKKEDFEANRETIVKSILKGALRMLETGEFQDESGLAEHKIYPEEKTQTENAPKNPDVRLSRRGSGSAKDDLLPAREAMAHIWENGVRVVKEGAPGYGEQSEAGRAAGAEAMNADVAAKRGQDWSVSMSEQLELVRAMTGNAAYPRVMKAMKDRPWLGQVTKKGETQIDAELFGIVDRTDRDVIKNDLKQMGMFRNEDPAWSMRHSKTQNENEREMSEFQLTTRLKTLADQRIAGTAGGGNRTALNVMAHEIGHIACNLPVRPNDPAILKGLHTLGDGLIKEFQKADVKKINLNQRFPGLNAEAAGIKLEALEFVRWWRGVGDVNAGPGKGFEDYFRKNDRELWAEVFGAFLAAPHELETRAPAVFREIKDAIGRSDVLMDAFRTIRANRAAPGGAAEAVMRRIEREWTADRDEARRKLESEIDVPVGGVIEEWKEYALKALVSQESPARHVVARAGKEQIAAAKKALADAKRKMRKGKATKADVAAAEKTLADVKEGVKRSVEDMDAAILDRQRGGGRGREYAIEMLQQFSENVKDAGLTIADFSRYLHAMNVKEELKGRATAAGMSAQEAHQVIEEMKKRLGKEKFTRLEAIDKMFHATYEKMILDDANLKEAFGEGFTNYCRSKAHYVTTRKQLGVDEIKTLMDERIRFKAMNPGRSDVMAEVGALIAVFGRHGSYADGDGFMKRLEGSFKMQGEPIAATLEKSMYMLEFGSRNHFVCELARIAKERNAEGFHVVEDNGRLRLPDNRRYGCVSFLKDGKRCTLIMPKAVAEGLGRHISESNVIIKAQRMLNELVTSYNLSFMQRNMIKSRASAENNLHFMRPSRLVTTAGYMGLRPEAVLLETAASFAVTRLPEKVMDNPVMRLVYGDATILGNIKQADRYARWMFHPEELSAYRRRADELAAQGDTSAAYAILSDIQHWKKLMKSNVFADTWNLSEKNKGRGEQNVIEILRRLDIELDDPNIGGWAGRMVGYAKRSARWVKMYNNKEEARVKIAALLAAEAYNQGRLRKGREPLSEKQIAYEVATYAGSPRFENKGTFFRWAETWAGSFLGVSWEGVRRTAEALVRHPWEWGVKAVNRISARAARQIGLGCGGFAALAHWLVQYFDEQGEEEMKKTAETIERFAKRATLAYRNVSDHRRRHSDIIPLGTCGKWTTFGIGVPLSDEDNLLMPFVDMTVNAVMKNRSRKEELKYAEWYRSHSDWEARRRKAKRRGEPFDEAEPKKPEQSMLTDPADMSYTWGDAIEQAVFGSGMVADVTQGTMLLNLFEDGVIGWFHNPYNTYTGRKNIEDEVFENRYKSMEGFKEFVTKMGKQAWNDVGGRVLFPMTTWDEDEGDIGGATRALWQETDMGTKGEDGTVRTEPDWFGKGVFHLLHDFPVLSNAACGMIFMNNGGNRRMMRRLQEIKKDNPMQAQIDRAAMEIIDWAQANGKMKGWKDDEFFEETTEKHGLSDEDKGTVMNLVTKKLQRIAEINGDLDIELRKAVEKLGDEGWYSRRVKRLITGYGLQEIIDGN